MTAALIAVSLALAAAVGGLIALAVTAIAATRRAGDEQTQHARLDEQLIAQRANTETEKRRADAEKERADALDAALARAAAAAVGPVDGAFQRLLQEVAAARAARSPGAAEVPDAGVAGQPSASAGRGRDDLLKPGE